MEYQSLLPAYETPGCTEGREGFYHLDRLEGCTETAKMKFLIRDHDHGKFLRRQELMEEACRYLIINTARALWKSRSRKAI